MSQTSKSETAPNEKYYREFIEQSSEGIFRIDFDEPIPLDEGIPKKCEQFFQKGFIGDYNSSFAVIFELLQDTPPKASRLSNLQDQIAFLTDDIARQFFTNDLKIENLETIQPDKSGQMRYFSGSLTGIVEQNRLVCAWGRQNDVTEEKISSLNAGEIEKHWRLTQKIEALGRLAGGIAHDFNNFLAVMMLQNDMLNLQLPAGSPLRHRTEEMKKATNKAAALVKQLLAIGRKQALNPQPVDINSIVTEFEKIFPTFMSDKINVVVKLSPDSGKCFIDRNQMIQSLIGLAQNSQEAMPEGGTLKIETEGIFLDRNSVRHKSQSEGAFVQITISDTGSGMDAATLESVFEPFFSTKKSKGVGLGLATVYGFIKQSKGFIWVESELDAGTTFKIQFPRIDQPAAVADAAGQTAQD